MKKRFAYLAVLLMLGSGFALLGSSGVASANNTVITQNPFDTANVTYIGNYNFSETTSGTTYSVVLGTYSFSHVSYINGTYFSMLLTAITGTTFHATYYLDINGTNTSTVLPAVGYSVGDEYTWFALWHGSTLNGNYSIRFTAVSNYNVIWGASSNKSALGYHSSGGGVEPDSRFNIW